MIVAMSVSARTRALLYRLDERGRPTLIQTHRGTREEIFARADLLGANRARFSWRYEDGSKRDLRFERTPEGWTLLSSRDLPRDPAVDRMLFRE
jgi:hypothetical protein